MAFSSRLDEAFSRAHALHRAQVRKGSKTPYIAHLMSVAAIVSDYGASEDEVIAALLHDAVEDQGGTATLDLIREQFGERVAQLVHEASDACDPPKPPWLERKQAHLEHVRHASSELRLLVAADKLHNVVSLTRELRAKGNHIWKEFRGGSDGSLWYYKEMVQALGDGWSHPILDELDDAVKDLRALTEAMARS